MSDKISFEEQYTVFCLNSNSNTYFERTFEDESSMRSFINKTKSSDNFAGRIFVNARITSVGLVEVF